MPKADPTGTSEIPSTARFGAATITLRRLRTWFVLLLAMDLLCRTGYQMGKSPVLPLFAKSLGAGAGASGVIVAISTIAGLLASPVIGTLSDVYGRRRLLLAGTGLFALMPFVYLWVRTPEQLFLVRFVHGFATATYGPVLSAWVADLFQQRRAEYMGWYRAVRTASYLLGPLFGGMVVFYAGFRLAWVVVGALGLLAFLPALALPARQATPRSASPRSAARPFGYLTQALGNPMLLAAGLAQAALYLGLNSNKAFLPLYALSVGVNPAQVGSLFSIQVAATMLAQPLGGRLADRLGRRPVILLGLLLVAAALPMVMTSHSLPLLALWSVILGLGEAAVMPSITTLGTELAQQGAYGSTLGLLDAMDNVGKAMGPIVAGLLLSTFSYATAFTLIAGVLAVTALLLLIVGRQIG
ncbi:MAG: MFS transporter [Chloroflexi bacterium]|nr:MFS transporter [Chloroflexota bacterium]